MFLPLALQSQRVNFQPFMSLKKLGRYDLIRVLGKGAMGLVYEGRDPNLDRRVAIKTIKVDNLSDEAAAEYEVRFRTEARSAARLQHPNIVSIYDSDRDIDIAFLVMEFVEGEDLKHHLDKGEVYTLEQTVSIMGDLLSALDYAHKQSIVHRDIKPANLLVQANGRIKLADFGVARIQDSGEATRTQGSIVGTLKYMSPEQLEGRPIDARADLFAAGVVLYQLLTGARPFDGDTDFAVIQKIVSHMPVAATTFNAKLPPALDAVVAKALAKSRDLRYATALEFADALRAACSQATDITIAPLGSVPGKGSNTTWTATMMAGESLVNTESGAGTNSGTNSGIKSITSSGTGASLVTQEVELVYWKDIKDSSDVEDIQGFLGKFPSGIYADLARRRLKNLGAPAGRGADGSLRAAAPSTTGIEKTVLMPRQSTGRPTTPTTDNTDQAWKALAGSHAPAPLLALTQAAPAIAEDSDPDATVLSSALTSGNPCIITPPEAAPLSISPRIKARSNTVWMLASVGLIAVAGVAFKLLSLSGTAQLQAEQVASPQSPASAASAVLPAAVAASGATVTAPATAASRPLVAAVSAAMTALRPAQAASKTVTAAAAKKVAPDKDKLAKEESAKTPVLSMPGSAKAQTPAAAPAANNPRAACEDRMLLGFQSCMAEQCAKPAFAQHPICAERRDMDERRRETERNR